MSDDVVTKPFWQSKTIYFNILAFIVAIAVAFGYQGELPADWEKWVTIAVTIINIVLRIITKQSVTIK